MGVGLGNDPDQTQARVSLGHVLSGGTQQHPAASLMYFSSGCVVGSVVEVEYEKCHSVSREMSFSFKFRP